MSQEENLRKKRHGVAAEVFRAQNQMQMEDQPQEAVEMDLTFSDEDMDKPQFRRAMPKPTAPPSPAPAPMQASAPSPAGGISTGYAGSTFKTSEELQLETEPVRVRVTGFGFWQRIIVPPNVYVVHTRMGKSDPVTIGMGLSFRFNPRTDSYLVVPAAMQTIGVVANCISQEKQGINVLAYVQWQIADFSVAYRKLDFSDYRDPLGIVNAQLREQAEAAIKDKIATMSVEEVLTDKEPVIEELTTRLKAVAEGRLQDGEGEGDGLGIKIVTVQIKEALVSSRRLWEDLQAPFRHEKRKAARISHLEAEEEIRQKELDTRRIKETSEAETQVEIERTKQEKQTEALQVRLTQESSRYRQEQETAREKTQLEEETTLFQRQSQQRLEAQRIQAEHEAKLEDARLESEAFARMKQLNVGQLMSELEEDARLAEAQASAEQERLRRDTEVTRLQAEYDLLIQSQNDELEGSRQEAELNRRRERELLQVELEQARIALKQSETEVERLRQEVRNLVNENVLTSQLIEKLPELAAEMPEIHEMKVIQSDVNGYNTLYTFVDQVRMIMDSLKLRTNGDSNGSTKAASNGIEPSDE